MPEDEDAKGALRLQLKQFLAQDEVLAQELKALLEKSEGGAGDGVTGTIRVMGDRNVTKVVGNISAGGDVSF